MSEEEASSPAGRGDLDGRGGITGAVGADMVGEGML